MKVRAQLQSIDAVEFSITLTAPVEDWKAFLKYAHGMKTTAGYWPWPVGGFMTCIEKMLTDLDKTHADVLVRMPEVPNE